MRSPLLRVEEMRPPFLRVEEMRPSLLRSPLGRPTICRAVELHLLAEQCCGRPRSFGSARRSQQRFFPALLDRFGSDSHGGPCPMLLVGHCQTCCIDVRLLKSVPTVPRFWRLYRLRLGRRQSTPACGVRARWPLCVDRLTNFTWHVGSTRMFWQTIKTTLSLSASSPTLVHG